MQESKAIEAETSRLHVGHLTRNVQQEHIQEIFSTFGTVLHVELAMDKAVNLPRGFAYVEFSKRSEAEEAQRLMDGGQLDGNQLRHDLPAMLFTFHITPAVSASAAQAMLSLGCICMAQGSSCQVHACQHS